MTKTILVADDSKTIQHVVALAFRATDFRVVQVGDGDEAFKRAAEIHPDVVLADVAMPGKNGYELCSQLKRGGATSDIPVLLMAGAFEPFDDRRAQEAQADGHIKKPFDSQLLIDRVRSLTGETISSEMPMSFAASLAARQRAEAGAQTSVEPSRVPTSHAPDPTLRSPAASVLSASAHASSAFPHAPPPTPPNPPPPEPAAHSPAIASVLPPRPAPSAPGSALRSSPFSLPRSPVPPPPPRDESRGLASDLGVPSPWSPAARVAEPPAGTAAAELPRGTPSSSLFGPPRPHAEPEVEARAATSTENNDIRDDESAWTKGEDVPIEDPEIIEDAEVIDESDTAGMTLESTVPSLEPPEGPRAPGGGAEVDMWALAEVPDHENRSEYESREPSPAPGQVQEAPEETAPDLWSTAEPAAPPSSEDDIEAIEEIQIDEIPIESSTRGMAEGVQEAMQAVAEPIAAQVEELVPGMSRADLVAIAREVIEQIAWEVVPELAETIIRAELDRLLRDRD